MTVSYLKLLLLLILSICFRPGIAQTNVSTFAGTGNAGFTNGTLSGAEFNNPFGLCSDALGNILIADAGNNRIRKINTQTGLVSTFAGDGIARWHDGPADSASFNSPSDICADVFGNIYVSDFNNQRIRKISTQGIVTTIAGDGTPGYQDGTAATARFDYPRGIAIDTFGNIYVSDSWNHRIRKISTAGIVSTYAGGGSAMGVSSIGALVDGPDTTARFYTPAGLAIDHSGVLYVADAFNHRIRSISPSGRVTTIVGSGPTGPVNGGFADGDSATAILNTPTELSLDHSKNLLFISDTYNDRIRRTDLHTFITSTYAGGANAGFNNGIDSLAQFDFPRGLVFDALSHHLFVADYNNNMIRLISPRYHTGINDNNKQLSSFSFGPNPADDIIAISGLPSHTSQLLIINAVGESVRNISTTEEDLKIDISTLPAGMYWIFTHRGDRMQNLASFVKNPR